MSFGHNFAYSKTKEQDIALMLAASVIYSVSDQCRCKWVLRTAQA